MAILYIKDAKRDDALLVKARRRSVALGDGWQDEPPNDRSTSTDDVIMTARFGNQDT